MKWLNDLRTSVKLIGSFTLIALIAALVGVLGIYYLRNVDAADTKLYQNQTVPISQLGDIAIAFQRTRVNLRDMVLAETPEEAQKYADTVKQLSEQIDTTSAEYKKLIISTAMQNLYDQYTRDINAFVPLRNKIEPLALANKDAEALVVMRGDALVYAKAVEADIDNMMVMKVDQAKATSDSNSALASQATIILVVIIVIAVLLAISIGIIITNTITSPLSIMAGALVNIGQGDLNRGIDQKIKDSISQRKDEFGTAGKGLVATEIYVQEMAQIAATLAEGDLTVDVEPKSNKDELGIAFARMVASLHQSLREVADNANNLGAASAQLASAANQAGQATSQISTTMQQVSKGIAQETVAVTRTSSSTDQMSRAIDGVAKGAQEQAKAAEIAARITTQINSAIQQVAENAQAVTREAANATTSAQDGANKVKLTLKGMESIRGKVGLSAEKVTEMGQHSEKITVIVETIEDIASQTNLLALNAAIEAARAGEHGKGFAVVADEVRKLAERASSSTKEIGGLIKGIQRTVSEAVTAMQEGTREVENGVLQANDAGAALESILKSVEAVTQQAEEAAAAAEQMSASATELVAAVDSVSAVVEENTAATEEMAAGSSEVSQAIENIASVSEENSAAVEEVSASTEEMSAQVEEVSASSQSLEEMAQVLRDLVARFKLSNVESQPFQGGAANTRSQPVVNQTRGNGHGNGRSTLAAAQVIHMANHN